MNRPPLQAARSGRSRGLHGASESRGQVLAEFALVLPLLLLLLIGIIEMGAAWRTYQVVTNVAREGGRYAVLPSATEDRLREVIDERLVASSLDPALADVTILCDGADGLCVGMGRTGTETTVRIGYPHEFQLIRPVIQLVGGGGEGLGTITIPSSTVMRNE